jgi:integrase
MRLTKRTVDALRANGRDVIYFDGELPGFGLRVKPSGVKSYLIQYRTKGRTRRFTVGAHGVLTAEQARKRARKQLLRVNDGADPSEEQRQTRKAETVGELCERYLEHHARVHKKPSSIRGDEVMLKTRILPALGKRKVGDVTRADVQRLHHTMKDTPYQANRTLALLSKMMNLAERWGIRPDGTNPCRHVERYREKRRQRYLSAAELAELGKVLAKVERECVEWHSVVPALRLLIFTGARTSEVLTLRWEWVDFERRCLLLPDSKTGEKVIHLNAPASKVLADLERDPDNPHVIRGRLPGTCLVNLKDPWGRMRKRAKIPDVRVHDLRHSFAAVAAGAGSSLPVIGALLGHSQPQTTARYAHLADDPLKAAAETVGARLAAAMAPKQTGRAKVVALQRGR